MGKRNFVICGIMLLVCYCKSSNLPLLALPSAADIENTIKEAKDIPKEKKFSARAADNEVQLATYSESDIDKDCKIDAVLLARTIMNKFSDITRVVVNFHNTRNPKSYKQVTVTKPEIIAFGSGQVDSELLLNAIRLDVKADESSTTTDRDREHDRRNRDRDGDGDHRGRRDRDGDEKDRQHAESGGDRDKTQGGDRHDEKSSTKDEEKNSELARIEALKKEAKAKGRNPEEKWTTYRVPGLAFDYPAVWRKSRELDGEYIVNIMSEAGSTIGLKLYQPKKKEPVMETARHHAHGHQRHRGFKMLKPSAIIDFGQGKRIKGVCENFGHEDDGKFVFEKHVYFGWPGYVYKFYCESERNDYNHTIAVFDKVLSSVRLESTAKNK